MKKTGLIFVLFLLILVAMLTGCASTALPNDLYVIAEDEEDVPAGDYTLAYQIKNYAKYERQYDLHLTVNVYDENNAQVEVKNNRTMGVEEDKTYTAVILVYGVVNGESKLVSGDYRFSAVKSPRMVTLLYEDSEIITQFQVKYGKTLPLSALPELEDRYTSTDSGTTYTELIGKRWAVKTAEGYVDLTEEYLQNITTDKQVYAVYEYETHPVTYTIFFRSNGGSVVPDTPCDSQTIPTIQPAPTREGYTFLGWCADEACTTYYNWIQSGTLSSDLTLYAKWVQNTENPTSDASFTFEQKTDDYGNGYYVLACRDPENMTGDVRLPNSHEGLPVRYLADKAFAGAAITSVYIPNTYVLDGDRLFNGCAHLTTVTFETGSTAKVISPRCFSECHALTTITLPNSVTRISTSAFHNCLSLRTITLPTSLVFIEKNAFKNCSLLTGITLPSLTEVLSEGAFADCTSLTELIVPADTHLNSVHAKSFENSALRSVTLPMRIREKDLFFDCENINVLYE